MSYEELFSLIQRLREEKSNLEEEVSLIIAVAHRAKKEDHPLLNQRLTELYQKLAKISQSLDDLEWLHL